MFKFGVDTFIWSEAFSEKDLWIIPKAKNWGLKFWTYLSVIQRASPQV